MNLKELGESLGLNETEYGELLALFIETGHADLEKINDAIERADGTAAARAAHSLKGASVNLGLNDFFEAAKRAEGEAKKALFENLAASVQRLREALERMEGYTKGPPG